MDLLKTMGSKESASGVEKSTASQGGSDKATVDPALAANGTRGENLLGQIGKKNVDNDSQTSNEVSKEPKPSSKEEPAGSSETSSWSTESALKEIKKLREENKATRLKYEESLQNLKAESEARIQARERDLEYYIDAEQQLKELKEKEADKKRDLSERLAHREAVVADLKSKMEASEKVWQEKISKMEDKVSRYEAEAQAQQEVYNVRLQDELKEIPEKFKSIASLIVRGAGDSRDALIALNEARLQGVFEDKTVVVNHSVPGASEGARSNKDRLEEVAKAEREKMTSSKKIQSALKDIRQGNSNSAFRIK